MTEWLANLLSRVSFKGAPSRRLVSVTVGAVILVWLAAAAGLIVAVPDIPGTVLILLALVLGTSALQPPAP
jgi:hypothetical protein